jgi:hypothetical protein
VNLVALSTIRVRARNMADILTDQNVTDTELNDYVNMGAGEFYDLLIKANENYNLSQWSFNTTTGTDTYPLATDHYKTKGVDAVLQNSTTPATVNRFEFMERNKYGVVPLPVASVSPVVAGFEYEEENNNVRFIPGKTLANIPIIVWYYPVLQPLVADTDTIDVVTLGWDMLISMKAALICKDKQESDCTVLLGKIADIEKKITQSSARRNQTQAHRMISSLRGPGARGRYWR